MASETNFPGMELIMAWKVLTSSGYPAFVGRYSCVCRRFTQLSRIVYNEKKNEYSSSRSRSQEFIQHVKNCQKGIKNPYKSISATIDQSLPLSFYSYSSDPFYHQAEEDEVTSGLSKESSSGCDEEEFAEQEGRIAEFLNKWQKNKPVKGDARPEKALENLEVFQSEYSKLREERKKVCKAKEALELQDSGPVSSNEEGMQVLFFFSLSYLLIFY